MKRDIYGEITGKIVRQLEQGVRPWVKPWAADQPERPIMMPLRHNGTPCRGINILALWMQANEKGYRAPR